MHAYTILRKHNYIENLSVSIVVKYKNTPPSRPLKIQGIASFMLKDKAEILRNALHQTYYNCYASYMSRSRYAKEVLAGNIPGIKCDYHEDHIVRLLRQSKADLVSAVKDNRKKNPGRPPKKSADPELQKLILGCKRELGSETSMEAIRQHIVTKERKYKKYSRRSFYRNWNRLSEIEKCTDPEELEQLKRKFCPLPTSPVYDFSEIVFGDWMKVAKKGLVVTDDDTGEPIIPELLGHLEGSSRACCGILMTKSQPTAEDALQLAREVIAGTQCKKLGLSDCRMISQQWHTDRGSAYTSGVYMAAFRDAEILHSFSRPKTPTDNPYIERYWCTLRRIFKISLIERLNIRWKSSHKGSKKNGTTFYISFSDLQKLIWEAVHIYNTQRVHSHIKMTPAQAWEKGVKRFVPKLGSKEADECFQVRETVTLKRFGSFTLGKSSYYCRGANRLKGTTAVVTWPPGGSRSRLRVYVKGQFKGIGSVVVKDSSAERDMRESFQKDCDESQTQANLAGAVVREKILHADKSLNSCVSSLSDHDIHAATADRNIRKKARQQKVKARDEERIRNADKLSINRPYQEPDLPKKETLNTPPITEPSSPVGQIPNKTVKKHAK
jgi:hypothetical protein